jgi:hypothetical protein
MAWWSSQEQAAALQQQNASQMQPQYRRWFGKDPAIHVQLEECVYRRVNRVTHNSPQALVISFAFSAAFSSLSLATNIGTFSQDQYLGFILRESSQVKTNQE